MNPKLLKGIIAIVIIGVAFMLLKSFLSPGGTTSTVTINNNVNKFVDDRSVVILLNRLNTVTLDEAIFSSAVFNSLHSFERPIEAEPIGRHNPFAPIGTDGLAPVRNLNSTSTLR